jgi:hypothetical protein
VTAAARSIEQLVAERDRLDRALSLARTRSDEKAIGGRFLNIVLELERIERRIVASAPAGRANGLPHLYRGGRGVLPPADFTLSSRVATRAISPTRGHT